MHGMSTMPRTPRAAGWSLIAWLCLVPSQLAAAELTEVADGFVVPSRSFSGELPFDLNLTTAFGFKRESGKITREPFERVGIASGCNAEQPFGCVPVDELEYDRSQNTLELALEMGLHRDLSVSLSWSYVIAQDLEFRYADGVGPNNSSIDPQSGNPDDTLFANDFEARHRGSGPLQLDIQWAPFNQMRDDVGPTWVLELGWSIPWTASVFDPAVRATPDNPGPVGDGVHRLTLATSFSKRLQAATKRLQAPTPNRLGASETSYGLFDPYVRIAYTLPIPQRGFALDDLIKNDENPFGARPSAEFNVRFGSEFIAYEDPTNHRKLALDLGFDGSYISDGRNYSLLTDPLGELTFEEEHGRLGGRLGFYLQLARSLRLQATFQLGFVTEHFLTFEDAGEDLDGDGQVLPGEDDLANPFFCGFQLSDVCADKGLPSVDQVGFRFKDEEHWVVDGRLALIVTL